MKKTIYLLIYFCLSSVVGYSQTSTNASQSFYAPLPESMLGEFQKGERKMITLLQLTPEQLLQLDTLNDNYISRFVLIHDNKSLNIKERYSEIKLLKEEREQLFETLLTKEQHSMWENLKKRQQKKIFTKGKK